MSLESPHLLAAFQADDMLFFDDFIQGDRGFFNYFRLRFFFGNPGGGKKNLFETAATFGQTDGYDESRGEWSWGHSNGNGVLFYPGTDTLYPEDSYGINGPIASLRLKHWRRGLQDVDYIALAAKRDPAATQAIVDRIGGMIRRVGVQERFVFAGGVAHNSCLRQLFAESLGVPVTVPEEPQIVGALGAALHAALALATGQR